MYRLATIVIAASILSTSANAAGFDDRAINVFNQTQEDTANIDTNCVIKLFDLDADDDGTEDNADADSFGDADFINCLQIRNAGISSQVLGAADLSTAYSVTTSDNDRYLYVSGNMTITLPDGGTATNTHVGVKIGTAPTGTDTIVIKVPADDNSVFYGVVGQNNIEDSIMYASSLTGDADTITLSSSSVLAGDWLDLVHDGDGVWHLSGALRFASALSREWEGQVQFSSSVTSTD